jgi:SpoVK/Ycf46/Vps4 family AAA+-type ATPase
MTVPDRSKAELTTAEALLVDVVRLAARGDSQSIPSRVQRLLAGVSGRRADGLSANCRRALKDVLKSAPEESQRTASLRRTNIERFDRDEPSSGETPVLNDRVAGVLDRLIRERRNASRLAVARLEPTRTLLLSGAPGVGKTMTAEYLARELKLPLVRVEPSTIITSLLGESARRLADTFADARSEPCVMLLDEFDAFAKRRDDEHELGELKRFVTTLLVEIERWPASGMLVAATNHPQLLDPAVQRRFDVVLDLPLPGGAERTAIISRRLLASELAVSSEALRAAVAITRGMTGSDISRAVHAAARLHVLEDQPLPIALLRAAIGDDPSGLDDHTRAEIANIASEAGGLSTRAIGELLGCSHSSVRRLRERAARKAA